MVAADNGVALLLRHIGKITKTDRTLLLNAAKMHNLMLFVQEQENIEHWLGKMPCYHIDD